VIFLAGNALGVGDAHKDGSGNGGRGNNSSIAKHQSRTGALVLFYCSSAATAYSSLVFNSGNSVTRIGAQVSGADNIACENGIPRIFTRSELSNHPQNADNSTSCCAHSTAHLHKNSSLKGPKKNSKKSQYVYISTSCCAHRQAHSLQKK